MKRKHSSGERLDEGTPGQLKPELEDVLERVGKAGYARATAPDFAPGGKYNRQRRQRYAIT